MEKSINSLLVYSVFSIDIWAVHISYSCNVSFDMSAKQRVCGEVWRANYLENVVVAVIFMEKHTVFIISLPVFPY